LFPWPFEIAASAFQENKATKWTMSGDIGSFDYAPQRNGSGPSVADELGAALDAALAKQIEVDGVVMPEAAIDEDEFWQVAGVLEKRGIGFLLAGVRGKTADERHGTNIAKLGLYFQGEPHGWHVYDQQKHHRWCIDAGQIYQYHLGAALDPGRRLWENIEIPPRTLHFVALSSWLTLCHLICEDLARIDPVSDVVRAVGPNLLIALLLDGPQLEQRWPARYASVLADDPGSSVLTLSSLGLVRRSTVRGHAPSRVVGLWKDRVRGTHELALDRDSNALVLALCAGLTKEYTADGRDDDTAAGQLVLGGIEQLSWGPVTQGPKVTAKISDVPARDVTSLCIVTDALALSPAAYEEILEIALEVTDTQAALRPAIEVLRSEFADALQQRGQLGNIAVLEGICKRLHGSYAAGACEAGRALKWTLHGRTHTTPR
jgi:hypothetical protein